MTRLRPHRAAARFHRLRRRLGFDRNDLRRDVDRLQRSVALALVCAFTGAGLAVSVIVWHLVLDAGERAEVHEARTRHQVVATVTAVGRDRADDRTTLKYSQLSWRAPDGTPRTGFAVTTPADKPGAARTIWVGADGRQALRPMSHRQALGDAWFAAAGAAGVVGLPAYAAYRLVRRRCDRRRYRLWDESWERLDCRRSG